MEQTSIDCMQLYVARRRSEQEVLSSAAQWKRSIALDSAAFVNVFWDIASYLFEGECTEIDLSQTTLVTASEGLQTDTRRGPPFGVLGTPGVSFRTHTCLS